MTFKCRRVAARATSAHNLFKAVTAPLTALAVCLALTAPAQAAPITGDPLPANSFGWTPNSTNALNFAKETPGRVGQDAPYVLFVSNTTGSVTLDFFNGASGLAFFEVRIDDIATGLTPHPVVTGDTIHTGGVGVASGVLGFEQTFAATNYVDVRLALGGERDWDFDWVRFETAQATVPEPGTLAILGLGLAGLGIIRRRKLRC